jgi:hypothetical protein
VSETFPDPGPQQELPGGEDEPDEGEQYGGIEPPDHDEQAGGDQDGGQI